MASRDAIYRLVDELTDAELDAVHRFLTQLRGPELPSVLAAAPWDDEPETADEQAEEDFRQGRVLSHAEVRRRLLGEP